MAIRHTSTKRYNIETSQIKSPSATEKIYESRSRSLMWGTSSPTEVLSLNDEPPIGNRLQHLSICFLKIWLISEVFLYPLVCTELFLFVYKSTHDTYINNRNTNIYSLHIHQIGTYYIFTAHLLNMNIISLHTYIIHDMTNSQHTHILHKCDTSSDHLAVCLLWTVS